MKGQYRMRILQIVNGGASGIEGKAEEMKISIGLFGHGVTAQQWICYRIYTRINDLAEP